MTGTAKPVMHKKILPKEKRGKELFIAKQFAQVQKVAGSNLTDIRLAEDDSDGKADVLAVVNSNKIGIQLTELKIEHRVASADRARKMTEALLKIILIQVNPSYRIFVNIRSPLDYSNNSVKLFGKRLETLALLIAEGIQDSIFSPSTADYFDKSKSSLKPNSLIIPDILKETITSVELSKIPEDHNTMCQGRGNVFINFNYDTVTSSDELDETLVEQILKKKANSKADTLLVWTSDEDFWGQEVNIQKKFVSKAQTARFDNIYLFFFINSFINSEEFFQANRKVLTVKETS